MQSEPTDTRAVDIAAEIVSAYVSRNSLPAAELPNLLRTTYGAIVGLGTVSSAEPAEAVPEIEKPSAAQIKKSITPDGLISFIDGKRYQTLKRHLSTRGMEPRAYRARYGLPDDYPMVSPNYAKKRSELAKSIGLGRGGVAAQAAE